MEDLKQKLKDFVSERDWEKFHSTKNLVIQLSVEASELLEHFIWTSDETHRDDREKMEQIKEEVGDVLNCLILVAEKLDLDLIDCGLEKLEKTKKKYPVEHSKGRIVKKYYSSAQRYVD